MITAIEKDETAMQEYNRLVAEFEEDKEEFIKEFRGTAIYINELSLDNDGSKQAAGFALFLKKHFKELGLRKLEAVFDSNNDKPLEIRIEK